MTNTTNYQLPKYAGSDAPNLITGYNSAMDTIDTQLKANADAIAAISGFSPNPQTDTLFDVTKLSGAKVTSTGIVYIPASS